MKHWQLLLVGMVLVGSCQAQPKAPELQLVEFTLPPAGLVAGDSSAAVVIVEFGSHACEVCRKMVDSTLPVIQHRFLADRRVQYRFVEAGNINLDPLSAAFECLAEHRGLFEARIELNRLFASHLDSLARLVQNPVCARGAAGRRRRSAERVVATRLGVPGTPTMVVGKWHPNQRVVGWVLVGFQTADSLQRVVDRALTRLGEQS